MPATDTHHLGPLLHGWRSGDQQAGNTLLGNLRPYLKVLIRSWLGPDLHQQVADSDVVQVVLLRITQGFDGFRGQSVPELLGWAKQIAYHAALDHLRRPAAPVMAGGDLLQQVASREPSPLATLESEEEALRLAAALEELPESRRSIIQARVLDRLPFDEISRRTGKPAGALRVLFSRAVQQLRQILEANP